MRAIVPPLKGRLRARDPLRMVFVKMPCAPEIELAGASGLDAVIIDTEHGPDGGFELEHHLRAAQAARVPALVRIPNADPARILRALDAGADGVVVAHVRDGEEAARVVDAAYYPPAGHRGLALTTRAGGHGTIALSEHLSRAAEQTVVVVQIEDADAVDRSAEILGVGGVDAVLIGATDLSISLGSAGQPEHPRVQSAIEKIRGAARGNGVAIAEVVSTPAEAESNLGRGVTASVFVSTLLIRDAFRAVGGRSSAREVEPQPLVLLPGMLGTEALWDEVAPSLAGLVPVRFARIDLDDSVEEMAASVVAAAPPAFALAGHSLGAIVALAVARLASERVTGLALLNASARPPTSAQLEAWTALQQRTEGGDFSGLLSDFARANVAAERAQDQELLSRIEAMGRQVGPRGLLRQLTAQRERPDSRPMLAQISCPTLVISAALDTVCPPELQDELASGISNATLTTLEHCGHMSPLEAPAAVATKLGAWASAQDTAAA